MRRNENIRDIVKPPDQYRVQVYMSNAIQVADILEYLLQFTGEADVFMSSFSISEEFLRRLFFLRKKIKIKSFDVILDFKGTQKTLLLWPFIHQTIERCFLADNHSKVLIIRGEELNVAVVTSQNLTRGNRYESGAVISDPEAVASLYADYCFVRDTKSIPFNDIFRSTIEAD